jgi:hypothetical protein
MNRKQYALLALLTILSGLAGGAATSLILSGQPVFAQKTDEAQKTEEAQKIVEANGLRLVDKDGKVRGLLSVDSDGNPNFFLHDKSEKGGIVLAIDPNGSSVRVLDENGNSRAVLGSTDLKKTRSGYVEKRPLSSLVLLDKNKDVVWKSPQN